MRAEWPLVGREIEVDAITGALANGRSVVLTGQAGVGKSRLAAECLKLAATTTSSASMSSADGASSPSMAPLRVAGTPAGADIPYAALAGLLGLETAEIEANDIVAAVAKALATSGPDLTLLQVDDAHDLDDASATVLHQVVTARLARVVFTQRGGAPLSAATRALMADNSLVRIPVARLREADVIELLDAVLGGTIDGHTARRFADTSGGNVLFLRELVQGSRSAGVLAEEAGVWRLTSLPSHTPLLTDLVDGRLAPLDDAQREAVEVLALAEPVDLELLGRVVELNVVETLERIGLVGTSGNVHQLEASLVHPIYGERVRAQMPATAKLRISRLLADASDHLAHRSLIHQMRSAVWRLESGQPGDPARMTAAAHLAFAAGDTGLTARLAVAAFNAGASVEVALLAIWCLSEQTRFDDAWHLLIEARGRAATERERVFLEVLEAEQLWWYHDERDRPIKMLEILVAEGGLAARFGQAQLAVCAVLEGRSTDATEMAAPLLGDDDPWVAQTAALATSLGHLIGGRSEQGSAVAEAAFGPASTAPQGATNGDPGVHLVSNTFNLVAAGRIAEAESLADLIYDVAISRPGRHAKAWAAMLKGEVALVQGRLVDAQRHYTEGEVAWSDASLPGLARWCASFAGLAAAYQGRRGELAQALERGADQSPERFTMLETVYRRAAAWSAHLHPDGDGDGGNGGSALILREAVDDLLAQGCHQLALEVVMDMLRMGHVADAHELAQRLELEGELSRVRLRWIEARRNDDGYGLTEVSASLESLGMLLEAAEASAHAAATHRQAGRSADASRCAGRSGLLRKRCQQAATPPLVDRKSASVASPRELEVARMAASGLSNKTIAERLVVSERTVENHLYRVFAKLGVSSRDALGDVLTDHEKPSGEHDGHDRASR